MFQIDQSGKIEDTATSSVLGASNLIKTSVFIGAKEKRKLQEHFRRIGKPQLFRNAEDVIKLITKKAGGYLKIGLSPTSRHSSPGFVSKTITKKRKMSR